MHENLKHKVIKHFNEKLIQIKKYSNFQLLPITVNNFSDILSNNIDDFKVLLPNHTNYFFRAHIKQHSHLVTTK